VTEYQLAWDDPQTGRLRPHTPDSPTLAWLRVSWTGDGPWHHTHDRVDLYSHDTTIRNRSWIAAFATIPEAVAYCHTHLDKLRTLTGSPGLPAELRDNPWEYSSVVTTD